MDSYDILVIILSVALVISLVVWIIAGTLIIQVMKKLKAATETAQQAVENIEEVTSQLKAASKATAAGSLIHQLSKVFRNKDDK